MLINSPVRCYALPLLLAFLAVFFAIELAYPRFPATDEIFFKAAGRNLSQVGTFAAPEIEGYLHSDPPTERVYFAQLPFYSLLFAQWAHVFGFGWAACVSYDAFISAALALAVFGVTTAVANVLLGPTRFAPGLALLPAVFTLLFRQVARPRRGWTDRTTMHTTLAASVIGCNDDQRRGCHQGGGAVEDG
jgi:hypothetical protein